MHASSLWMRQRFAINRLRSSFEKESCSADTVVGFRNADTKVNVCGGFPSCGVEAFYDDLEVIPYQSYFYEIFPQTIS